MHVCMCCRVSVHMASFSKELKTLNLFICHRLRSGLTLVSFYKKLGINKSMQSNWGLTWYENMLHRLILQK